MKIQWLCIHHSAVSYNKNADQWKANNNYHRKKWNFKSSLGFYLGYNYEISKAGIVRQARKDGERTAACYQNGMNDGRAIHIEIDGNFDIEMPTEAQKSSLRRLLLELVERYPQAKITYHRKWATYKSCPGKLIKDNWAKNLLKENMLTDKLKLNQIYSELLCRLPDEGANSYLGMPEEEVRKLVGKSEERMLIINLINKARQIN